MTKPLSRPWTRRPKEPANWYARFDAYLSLGPTRSLESAFRKCRESDPDLSADRPGAQWYAIARTWEWEDRAHAYDEQNRLRIRAADAARRHDTREDRLSIIQQTLRNALSIIRLAEVDNLDVETARALLPTARLLLKDLLTAQRSEIGLPEPLATEEAAGLPPFTADDLALAQATLIGHRFLPTPAPDPPAKPPPKPRPARRLFLITGKDVPDIEVTALRAVRRDTGMEFHRILNASGADIDTYLRRERAHGRPVTWMQITAHTTAGNQNILLHDGPCSGDWLADKLADVETLLLIGCQSAAIGDWLDGIRHVITLSDVIELGDSHVLAAAFWRRLASGDSHDAALAYALSRTSPTVAEHVTRHW